MTEQQQHGFADLVKHSTWLNPVATAGALPASAVNGAVIVALDTMTAWEFSTSDNSWHAFGTPAVGGGPAGGVSYSDAVLPPFGTSNVQTTLDAIKTSRLPTSTNQLWVDPSGTDATAHRGSQKFKFKTITAAVTAASAGDVIIVGAGTYVGDVATKTGVTIRGEGRRETIISGNVTWTPTGAGMEIAALLHLTVTGNVGLDGTGKSGGSGYLYNYDVSAATGSSIGRGALNADGLWLENIVLPEGNGTEWTLTITGGVLVAENVDIGAITAHSDALLSVRYSEVFGAVLHDGPGFSSFYYCELVGNVELDQPLGTGPFQEARYCIFYADVSVGDGFTWNAFECSFLGSTGGFGAGTINRDDGPFVGAAPLTNGRLGLVPTPTAGQDKRFLRGDGTWADVPVMVGATSLDDGVAGLVPQPFGGQDTRFLRGDGNWATIPQPTKASISTTDATPTTIWSKPLNFDTTYIVEATIVCVSDAPTKRAAFKRKAMVSRTLGGAAVLDAAAQAVGTDATTDGAIAAAFTVSGDDVLLVVTGVGTQSFAWDAQITFQSVSPGPS